MPMIMSLFSYGTVFRGAEWGELEVQGNGDLLIFLGLRKYVILSLNFVSPVPTSLWHQSQVGRVRFREVGGHVNCGKTPLLETTQTPDTCDLMNRGCCRK